MDQILEFLNSHGSVRQFTGKPISAGDEHLILATAERSPTSSNLHAYSMISVRDQSKKNKLAKLSGGQQHVADSALFLVFCADLHRLGTINRGQGYDFHGDTAEAFVVATIDAALAAGRALQAAQALGIGGVMVGGIRNNPEEVSSLLSLPDEVYPVMGMSLGYPEKPTIMKPRLPLSGLCFSEEYNADAITGAVSEYDQTINTLGYLKGREIETENYPSFEGVYSWSEHSARRMASKSPSVQRPHLLEYLRSKGFLKR